MQFSISQILYALGGSGGLIAISFTILKWIYPRVAKHLAERRAQRLIDQSQSVEMRRLDNDEEQIIHNEYKAIIQEKKDECERLEKKIKELESNHSLSRPTMTKIYSAMRGVGRQIDNVENLVRTDETKENIIIEIGVLQQKFEELDKLLP